MEVGTPSQWRRFAGRLPICGSSSLCAHMSRDLYLKWVYILLGCQGRSSQEVLCLQGAGSLRLGISHSDAFNSPQMAWGDPEGRMVEPQVSRIFILLDTWGAESHSFWVINLTLSWTACLLKPYLSKVQVQTLPGSLFWEYAFMFWPLLLAPASRIEKKNPTE